MPLEISRATRSALAVLGASFLVMAPPEQAVDTMTLSDRGIITPVDTMTLSDRGIITQPSQHSVDQTVEKLQTLLQAKGVTLFALVDHSGEAAKVGMKLPPTKLVIFGNPKAGTPLMLAAPSVAIDLPLKILVWEDAQGKVWLSYNSPAYLQQRHGLPEALLPNIAVVEALARAAGASSP